MLNFFDSVYSKIQSKKILNAIQKVEATKSITELVEKNEVMDYEPNKTYADKNDVVVIFYYNIFSLFDI